MWVKEENKDRGGEGRSRGLGRGGPRGPRAQSQGVGLLFVLGLAVLTGQLSFSTQWGRQGPSLGWRRCEVLSWECLWIVGRV